MGGIVHTSEGGHEMTNQERKAFREEARAGFLLVVLAFIAGIHMLGGFEPLRFGDAPAINSMASTPSRTTDDLIQ